jgi:hypothetical protein
MLGEMMQGLAQWSKTEIAVGLSVLVASVVGVLKAVKQGTELVHRRNERKVAVSAMRAQARQSFTERDIQQARRSFIELDSSNLDPSKELDLRAAVGVREPILNVLDREMDPSGVSRHILVLGDSGMGKTTLLLNLLHRELGRRPSTRRPMVLISLARDDALQRIKDVSRKADTVLLLDAFDEDPEANKSHQARLLELMKAAQDFRMVILTCRTQFFANDEEIPSRVGVLRIHSRQAGEEHEYTFRKIYLLPYNAQQVSRYLSKEISFWRVRERANARKMVSTIGDLAHRPMLLAVVPALVRAKREVSELFELYQFMVESWYRRESHWIPRDTLETLSKLLAVEMVINSPRRGSESLSSVEVQALVPETHPVEQWKLESRSFLNREASGRLKFSHRSIMEYFFVCAAIEGRKACLDIKWTEQMRQFLLSWGRCNTGLQETETIKTILNQMPVQAEIFPVHSFPLETEAATESALEQELAQPTPRAIAKGYPAHWSGLSLRFIRSETHVRVFDFADGLVWSVPRRPANLQTETPTAKVFNFDSIYGVGDIAPAPNRHPKHRVQFWMNDDDVKRLDAPPPTLAQFIALVVHLNRAQVLEQFISGQEFYWLRNSQGRTGSLVTVRKASENTNSTSLPHSLKSICSKELTAHGHSFVISLYAASSRATSGVLIACRVCDALQEYVRQRATLAQHA